MALYAYIRGKERPFMPARPLVEFSIENEAAEGEQTVLRGNLVYRDVTEPLGSLKRRISLKWKAEGQKTPDGQTNWTLTGSGDSALDKVSPAVNAAIQKFMAPEIERFMRERKRAPAPKFAVAA